VKHNDTSHLNAAIIFKISEIFLNFLSKCYEFNLVSKILTNFNKIF